MSPPESSALEEVQFAVRGACAKDQELRLMDYPGRNHEALVGSSEAEPSDAKHRLRTTHGSWWDPTE